MVEKECGNCRYYGIDSDEYPCTDCMYHSGNKDKWESDEEQDNVNSPAHYKALPVEDIIRETLTTEQFIGFCLGNEIKYRMRAGIKDKEKIVEDISKAEKYREWRNKAIIEDL